MNQIPTYLTHYYESEYGPFRNICDLPESEWDAIIEKEKDSVTDFNRFVIGKDFFRNRCEADDLLIQLYEGKFGRPPNCRPSYATLGSFDQTGRMYRHPQQLKFSLSVFHEDEVTFIYEDHGHLGWTLGSQSQPEWFEERDYHTKIFSKSELADAFEKYRWNERIQSARRNNKWVSSYVEAHIWVGLDTLHHRSQPVGGINSESLRSSP